MSAPQAAVTALAEIGERYAHGAKKTATGRDVCASADDVPRLVAAIEAVLKQHQPIDSYGTLVCDKCSFAFRTPWPCGEVDAITTALAGG